MLFSLACESRAPVAATGEVVPVADVPVEIAGCSATRRDPGTCVLPGGGAPLHLWVDSKHAPVVLVDGIPSAAAIAPVSADRGFRVLVAVRDDARRLAIATTPGVSAWSIELRAPPAIAVVESIRDALPGDGVPGRDAIDERALADLRALAEHENVDVRLAAARLEMTLLVDLGQGELALARGRAGLDLALGAGNSSEVIDFAHVMVHVADRLGDRAQGDWLLELQRIHLNAVIDAGQWIRFRMVRGRRALDDEDLRAAMHDLEIAARDAERLGFVDNAMATSAWLAGLYGRVGRTGERDALVERALAGLDAWAPEDACTAGMRLGDVAWALTSAQRADDDSAATERVFGRALAVFGEGGACDIGSNPIWSDALASLRVNHAYDALRRGDGDGLRARMAELDDVPLDPRSGAWRDLMRATLASLDGRDTDALAQSDALAAELDRLGDIDLAWRTSILRGRSLERLGRVDAALSAYETAEAWIDRAVGIVAADQGREGFAMGMHEGASRAIELLLRKPDPSRAAAIARRARSRALRPLGRSRALWTLPPDARARWSAETEAVRSLSRTVERDLETLWALPSDRRAETLRGHAVLHEQLRVHLDTAERILAAGAVAPTPEDEPPPGELVLVIHPLASDWVAFAIDRERVEATRFPALDPAAEPAAIATAILGPFAEQLAHAKRLRVLAMGPANAIAVHALPWHGAPLLARIDVVWGLDVATAAERRDLGSRAIVVGDPATRGAGVGRLEAARDEARGVADRLGQAGWQVELVLGEDATHERVVGALAGVDVLHWAGHGRHAGPEGWASALLLAGEAELDVADILAAPAIPDVAVLAGCDTALGDAALGAGGMNLASAFLLAGSAVVVASYGEISNEAALAYARELYRVPPPASAEALARWAARPLAAVAGAASRPADWSRLRVLVP